MLRISECRHTIAEDPILDLIVTSFLSLESIMATRNKLKETDPIDADAEVDSDDQVEEKDVKKGAKLMKKKSSGLNFSAICILLMMILPAMLTLGLQAYDMMYPKLAEARMIRERVQKCYAAAKPNEVVDIEKIMKKYAGKETVLLASLRNKYAKFSACQVGI